MRRSGNVPGDDPMPKQRRCRSSRRLKQALRRSGIAPRTARPWNAGTASLSLLVASLPERLLAVPDENLADQEPDGGESESESGVKRIDVHKLGLVEAERWEWPVPWPKITAKLLAVDD